MLLSTGDLGFPQRLNSRPRYKELCDWIVSSEELNKWMDPTTRFIQVLTLKGTWDPVTVIASLEASIRAKRSTSADVFVTLSDGHVAPRPFTKAQLMASLCFQLLKARPRLFLQICSLYEELKDSLKGVNAARREAVLQRCLEALMFCPNSDPVTLIIHHPVKTSSESAFSQLVKDVHSSTGRRETLNKVLIIREKSFPIPGIHLDHHYEVELGNDQVRDRLKDDIRKQVDSLIQKQSDIAFLKEEIIDFVCQEPLDLCLIHYFLRYLDQSPFLNSNFVRGCWKAFSNTRQAFITIFQSIPEPSRAWVIPALVWISHAIRPLTCTEFGALLCRVKNDSEDSSSLRAAEYLERMLCGLVEVDQDTIYVTNPALPSFLTDRIDEVRWEPTQSDTHGDIAKDCIKCLSKHLCLGVLSKDAPETTEEAKEESPHGSEGTSPRRNPSEYIPQSGELRDVTPLFDYAVMNWISHIELVKDSSTMDSNYVASILGDRPVMERWLASRQTREILHGSQFRAEYIQGKGPLEIHEHFGVNHMSAIHLAIHSSCAQNLWKFQGETEWSSLALVAAQLGDSAVVQQLTKQDVFDDEATLSEVFRTGNDNALSELAATKKDFIRDNLVKVLRWAVQLGNSNFLDTLLDESDLSTDPTWYDPVILHEIAKWNYSGPIEKHLKLAGPRFNWKCDSVDCRTTLHVASECGHSNLVSALIPMLHSEEDALDCVDSSQLTPLFLASKHGHLNIVTQLMDAKADPNIPNQNGQMPLHAASELGYHRIVTALIARTELTAKDNEGKTALHLALENDHVDVAQLLINEIALDASPDCLHGSPATRDKNGPIRRCALLDEFDSSGSTPLLIATSRNLIVAVKDLLHRGADCNLTDSRGKSALHIAAENGYSNIFDFLIRESARTNANDDNGTSALHSAASFGHFPMVQTLLEKHAKLYQSEEENPFLLACKSGHAKVVEILLPHYLDNDQTAGLIAASMNGHVDVVEVLLDYGVNKDVQDEFDSTALQYSAFLSFPRNVHLLLSRQANLEFRDNFGRTALSDAARNNSAEALKLLIAAGADLDTEDDSGETPLYFAARSGHHGCVQLLLKAGARLKIPESLSFLYDDFLELSVARFSTAVIEEIVRQREDELMKQVPTYTIRKILTNEKEGKERLQLFLNHGLSANSMVYDETMLHFAARHGRLDLVRLLLENPSNCADTNRVVGRYGTPLQAAAIGAHEKTPEIIMLLLEHDANPKQVSGYYGTPLQAAAAMPGIDSEADKRDDERWTIYFDTIRNLLTWDDDVDVVNSIGGVFGTALNAAAHSGVSLVYRHLRRAHANPDIRAGRYTTPLHSAAATAPSRMIRHILTRERRLSEKTQDFAGRFPLHLAVQRNDLNLVEMLGSSDDVTMASVDKQGRNALHFAAATGSLAVAWEILRHHQNMIHVVDKDGWSPLHWACHGGQHAMIDHLLKNKADVKHKSRAGWTPRHVAIYKDEDTVQYLDQATKEENDEDHAQDIDMENVGNHDGDDEKSTERIQEEDNDHILGQQSTSDQTAEEEPPTTAGEHFWGVTCGSCECVSMFPHLKLLIQLY